MRRRDMWMLVFLLGSIWGFCEVVLGGAIKLLGLPYRSAVLTGLGMGIMGVGVGVFDASVVLLGIPVVTILCKMLAVPLAGLPVMCKANSCMAVFLEAGALTFLVYMFSDFKGRWWKQAGVGFLSAVLASGVFYFLGMRVAPCQYLLSFNRPGGFFDFVLVEGMVWGLFSGLLFPVGYKLGSVIERRACMVPSFVYVWVVVLCWVSSAVAILLGV